ncbi:MAG: polysulfide reductase NrfD, partial [Chloroflexi bacterium]|nr:polysulfide reductase NrfD [Chloroflexota bacterium]
LSWLGIPVAMLAAVYTAFLFAQAEGRDLWRSPLLPFHLFVQSIMAGAAGFMVMKPVVVNMGEEITLLFAVSLIVNLLLTIGGEFAVPHASQVAAAAHMITHGRYRRWYWASVIGGLVLPLVLVGLAGTVAIALSIAGLLAIGGLYAYEWAFVMAPQQVPNN